MLKSTATLIFTLKVTCPYCNVTIDLADDKCFEGTYTSVVFSNEVHPLKGSEIECIGCGEEFVIDSMDIL